MRPVSDWSMIARARRVAATMSRLRMRCLTRGMLRGAIDKFAQTKAEQQGGKARVPGHLATYADRHARRSAASTANWISRNTAGCSGL